MAVARNTTTTIFYFNASDGVSVTVTPEAKPICC